MRKKAIKIQFEIEEAAKKRGFTLLGKYVSANENLSLLCPNRHKIEINPSNFRKGVGCVYCTGQKSLHPDGFIGRLRDKAEAVQYKVLGKYVNSQTLIKMQCNINHPPFMARPNGFMEGERCPYCSGNKTTHPDGWQGVFRDKIVLEKYQMIGQYVNARTKISLICPEGHQIDMTPDAFCSGKRCRVCKCKNQHSRGELEVLNFIKQFYPMADHNNELIKPLKIDIWIPELRKVVEYNGDFWHSLEKAKTRDARKRNVLDSMGILHITIMDSDYWKDKEKVLQQVKDFLGIT